MQWIQYSVFPDPKSAGKMYACDVDICDQEDSPVCKPMDEPGSGHLDMEGRKIVTCNYYVSSSSVSIKVCLLSCP